MARGSSPAPLKGPKKSKAPKPADVAKPVTPEQRADQIANMGGKAKKGRKPKAEAPAAAPVEIPSAPLPPINERTALELLDEATHIARKIDDLISEENALSRELQGTQKERKGLTKQLTSLLRDRYRGQGRLDFPAADALTAAPAGKPAPIPETLAMVANTPRGELRVECRAPGEWHVLVDGKAPPADGKTAAAFRTMGEAQKAAQDRIDPKGELTPAWKPCELSEPMDRVYVAFDGDRKFTAKQSKPGKWEVRDKDHRPLAIDMPKAKAFSEAAAEAGLKANALNWHAIDPDAPAPAKPAEKAPAKPAETTQGDLAKEAAAKAAAPSAA